MEQEEAFAKVEQQTDELQALRDTIEILQAGLELSEVQDRILTIVRERLGYQMSILEIHDDTGPVSVLRVEKISGIPQDFLKISEELTGKPMTGATFPMSQEKNLGVRAAKIGTPMTTNKLQDLFYPEIEEAICEELQRVAGIKTIAAVPFQWEGKTVGNLFVGTDAEQISEEGIRSLQTIANQTAIAMDSAKRFSQSQQSLDEVAALQETIRALLESTLDLPTVLDKILEMVTENLDFRIALLAVYDESTNVLRIEKFKGVPEPLLKLGEAIMGMKLMGASISMDIEENLGVKAAKAGVPTPTDKLHDLFQPVVSESLCDKFQTVIGAKAGVTVPFKLGDRLVGNMFVGTERDHILEKEIKSLQAFANQAAIAMDNARVYKLAEDRRVNAEKMAKLAISAPQLIHRMNSLLSIIPLLVSQVEKDVTDERLREKLEGIAQNARSALSTVQNWADRVRTVEIKSVSVNESVKTTLKRLKESKPKDVKVVEKYARSLPNIPASEELVEVFYNIIKNAFEAMSEDGGTLTVRSKKSGDNIEVSITDTGPGMRDEQVKMLFEPRGTTKAERGGLGLGMWWSKSVLEWFGGEIKVQTAAGKGTTFIVTLPIDSKRQ